MKTASYTIGKITFYALPVTLSEQGEYVLVVHDPRVAYDAAGGTLSDGGVPVATGVVLLKRYSRDVFLCRVGGSGS